MRHQHRQLQMGLENVSGSTSKQELSLSCMAEPPHHKEVGLEALVNRTGFAGGSQP